MDLYLKAVGFSNYKNKDSIKSLIQEVVNNPTEKYISNFGTEKIKVEYSKLFSKGLGLLIRGEIDEAEELIVESLIPYKKGEHVTDTSEVEIIQLDDSENYYAYCEEFKTATPITFQLQNVIDFLDIEKDESVFIEGVRLVALSTEGTIILPINKEEIDLMLEEEEDKWREDLIEQARKGDEEAIELLEIEALETSQIIQERLKKEDLLSILDGYLIPDVNKESVYSLLGNVEDVQLIKNDYTQEDVYILAVECMNSIIEICINKNDLVGIPTQGMRFKGTCWLQGHVEFS